MDHAPVVAMGCGLIMDTSTPATCLKCSSTGISAAHVARSKEGSPVLVRVVVQDNGCLGHTRVVVNSDAEPAMTALASRNKYSGTTPQWWRAPQGTVVVAGEWARRTVCVQTGGGMFKTAGCALEGRIGGLVSDDHAILTGLVRQAACLRSRYQAGHVGHTPSVHVPLVVESLHAHSLGACSMPEFWRRCG